METITCIECEGSGEFEGYLCYYCNGKPLVECEPCRGRGSFPGHSLIYGEQDADCGACEGKGVVNE